MSEVSVVCVQCDSEFTYEKAGRGRLRRYCSDTCRNLTYYGRPETVRLSPDRKCKGCGIQIPHGPRERNPRVWCSEKCRVGTLRGKTPTSVRTEQRRRWRERNIAKGRLTCAGCGDPMFWSSTSLPQGRARCLECRRAARVSAVPNVAQWDCAACGVRVLGQTARTGRYCAQHKDWGRKQGSKRFSRDKGHRRRARKYGVHYEYINPITIYVRDGWKCGLCGRSVRPGVTYPDPMSASLDHVVPISRGGAHEPANVQCAHLGCNMAKGANGHGEQLALIG